MIRELVSAAKRYTAPRNGRKHFASSTGGQGWQDRAWAHYDQTPEVRFAANWIGNAMSGARLIAGRRTPDGTIQPAPDGHPAAELVASIAGGPDGQAQLLGDFGPHLVVAGEGWIIIRPTGHSDLPDWRVLSVAEVRQRSGTMLAEVDGTEVVIPALDPDTPPGPTDPIAIRVWDAHPRRHMEADSPVRSSLPLLEELQLLHSAVAAIARSRLTGRGVLLVPQGTRFPAAPGQGDAEDDLIEVFMTVAETAIREPESAAATVPIILEVPAEAIGDIKRLGFESDFDELALRLRDEAIRRFATGLEIPPEIVLGTGEVNHWGTWQLSQEAIRLGVEPRLACVAHALTTQWLRPLLEDEGAPDSAEWMVWYDTSPLRVRQNRSTTALEVFDRGAISPEALRRETGFDESDAPTAPAPQAPDTEPDTPPQGGRRPLPVDETTTEPDTLPASAAPHLQALYAAADGLVYAALTAAGVRLRHSPYCPRPARAPARELDPTTLHTIHTPDADGIDTWRLLNGAWSRAPEVASRYGIEAGCLTASLDNYTRQLLAAGTPHTYDRIPDVVADCLETRP